MTFKVKKYILIGALVYLGFLGWYFQDSQYLLDIPWHPSDIYHQVGDNSTTTASAVPSSDQVFDAKMSVPMKSVTKSRRARTIAIHKATSGNLAKSSTTPRVYKKGNKRSSITAVGEGLHTVSAAKFRSFGAWGLINPTQQNRRVRRAEEENGMQDAAMYMMYPYPYPMDAMASPGAQDMQVASHTSMISSSIQSVMSR